MCGRAAAPSRSAVLHLAKSASRQCDVATCRIPHTPPGALIFPPFLQRVQKSARVSRRSAPNSYALMCGMAAAPRHSAAAQRPARATRQCARGLAARCQLRRGHVELPDCDSAER